MNCLLDLLSVYTLGNISNKQSDLLKEAYFCLRNSPMKNISQILLDQDRFFTSGRSKDIAYRRKALIRLRQKIKAQESAILNALLQDFGKPRFEGYATEYILVMQELDLAIKAIWKWQHPKKVSSSLFNFPSRDYQYYEPYGRTLLIAPWNYPFQLVFGPLIGAIAAGNTVVIKPSELTPATASLINTIVTEVFNPEHVSVVEGDKEVAQALLAERWDYIFFTGSVKVGKIVAQAAAKHLTPLTLELGGKSPCVVHPSAKIEQAAKRIVWGKFVNAGQTCIAPDYLLVHQDIQSKLIKALRQQIQKYYGSNPKQSPDFARIINEDNHNRLQKMLDDDRIEIIEGGRTDVSQLYIAPTLVAVESLEAHCMSQEIFGPILPVLTYSTTQDLEVIINHYEKPLSAYVFSRKRRFTKWFLHQFAFGGGVINDTLVHFVNKNLPFGGVGQSGIGSYHGKHSFMTFSHTKAIVKRATWLDIPVKYPPYTNTLKWVKRFMGGL